MDDLFEEGGDLRIDVAESPGLLVEDALQDLRDVGCQIRADAAGELVEHQPQGMQVSPPVDLHPGVREALGRGVLDRPHEGAGLGQPERLVVQARETQVHHLDDVVLRDEDVLGLHVAVDDSSRMDRGQALRGLAADVATELFGDTVELAEQVPQRLSLDVLHDEEVLLRPVGQHRVAVDGPHDVLVQDRPSDLHLAKEALEEPRRLEEVGVQDLESHARAMGEPGGSLDDDGLVHPSHPARAQLAVEAVGPETFADHIRSSKGSRRVYGGSSIAGSARSGRMWPCPPHPRNAGPKRGRDDAHERTAGPA